MRVRAVFRGMQAVGLSILCGLHVLAGCGGSSDRNDATAGRGSGGSGGAGTGGSSGKGSGGAGGSSGQGSGGSSGAGTGGSSGNAGSGGDSCCPEDACDVGETLYIGSPPFDATTRRATACSCEAWCARLGGYPTCDAGDEQVSGPCPAEDGCYQRFYQAMYVWCRRAGGEGGAGGAGGEAGAAGAAGAP